MTKPQNVLNSSELVTISILQSIKIDLLLEKTRLQRNGAVIEEQYIADEPEQSDFMPSEELLESGKVTFERLIAACSETADNDNQISVDEAIKSVENVEKSQQKTTSGDMIQMPKKKDIGLKTRITAWLAARGLWQIKKLQADYDYKRKKTDTVYLCYGIDYAIDLIDREIERQRKGASIKLGDRYICED